MIPADPVVVSAPPTAPHGIIAFPQRDFVSAEGYEVADTYRVEVIHPDGSLGGIASGITPVEDPETPGRGLVEVNHPGGACWGGDTVPPELNVTPDIRPGDRVRVTNERTGAADQTTVSNVTARRPVQTGPASIEIHGTAKDALGQPLPLDQIEQRLVAPGERFQASGARTLRATGDGAEQGSLSYDAPGSTAWTATYTGLSAGDMTLALEAESRGMWLGADPAAGTELTIFEIGAGITAGPSAPCTAPLEKLPPPPGSELQAPTTPANLTATATKSTVSLKWDPATDNVGVTDYGIYRNGVAIATVQNPDGSPSPPVTFEDKNRPPGTYTYTVDAADAVGNRSPLSTPATVEVKDPNIAPPADHDPPAAGHELIAFPARDFLSASGYAPGTAYTFSVIRDGKIVATSTPVVADSTGLAEVNHPGGGCWEGVTPNIRPGDAVRITDPNGISDQTTVAGVTAERPIVTAVDPITGGGTIVVHGTAQDALGNPLPVDQIEQRLVAGGDRFDFNGRRTLRAANAAGEDGTLAYDAAGSTKWTATYNVQTPDDLARAVGGKSTSGITFVGAESRAMWLGRDAALGNELTIYENGPDVTGGPAAGIGDCIGGVAETPAANVKLSPALKFAETAVGSPSASQEVTITNTGDAPLHIGRAYLAGLNPGDFVIMSNTADGATVAPNDKRTVTVAFKPRAAGTRQATLSFMDDAANTTDQSVALSGTTPADPGGKATAPIQSLATGQQIAPVANKPDSTIEVGLKWSVTGTRSELQMSTDNGKTWGAPPVGTVVPDGTGEKSTTVTLKMGSVTGLGYQFRVHSCDATACGAWATGPAFTLQPLDDSGMAAAVFKGNWTTERLANAYGGTVRWAAGSAVATIVDRVQFTVSGNAAWVSSRGPDRGLAQVQVDNGKPEVVDLYSDVAQPAVVVWARDALPPGQHTVTVTVLGKRSTLNPAPCNTGTKCARVDVDASVMIR